MTTPTAHLAVYDTLADWEVGYLMAELRSGRFTGQPWEVRTVATSTAPITTMGGVRILPDLTYADVSPADSGLLVLPGATTFRDPASGAAQAIHLARAFLDAQVMVAAICGATEALANAGLLDERRHTSGALEALQAQSGYHGAEHYVNERAVFDQGLVTAGPQSPAHFAKVTLGALGLASAETLDAWEGVFYAADPSAYGRLMQAVA